MGPSLEPSLANAFLSYHEKNWLLNSSQQGFKLVFYWRYVDNIFILFKSNDHVKYFQEFLNSCHISMSFSMETERQSKFSFLDIEVICEQGKFSTTICRKPTFSGVDSNFGSFLPSVYKFCMVYTLVYKCFHICLDWKKFHAELTFLKKIFRKNGYPFKKLLESSHLVKVKVPKVETKRLLLVLPCLGIRSLQTRTKIQQAIKGVLNCCKLEIAFICQTKLSNSFLFKDPIPKDLISGVVCKLQCGLCNDSYYGESIRHLDIRSGDHIGVSALTGKKVEAIKNSRVRDHILHFSYLPSFDNFSILAHENKKLFLGIKESL